jgi:hypothetical protein
MTRGAFLVVAATALMTASSAAAQDTKFTVQAQEFDPGKTNLVQSAWLPGIGCPTNAKTATPNTSFTGVSGFSTFSDPACQTGGDSNDKGTEGLLLAKTGPSTTNFASAAAEIKGLKKDTKLTELGWDIRKPNDTDDPRGSHCGAGAPRWNIATADGGFFFIGCNSPPPTTQANGGGFIRERWGGGPSGIVLAFPAGTPSGCAVAATGGQFNISNCVVTSLEIILDEGQDTGPDNFGLTVLDNIDINGVLVGRGNTDAN